ncbi:hypothetical protein EUA06_18750 [Nocardioides glacieisoli]|uniref:Uncharacterized protein n=1 Tax=Nocardioides glacieisoli TaxID=1168730 RepID=A0A4Q2RNV1_9ACTN|nr:hypothetical protein [Nocardioides glacieisoli]RYB88823.1 hypothetical protein EUA06_18750 [Nocardioides glacieisoli]
MNTTRPLARHRTLLAAPLLVALAFLTACGAESGSDEAPDTATSSSSPDATTETGTLALTADGSVAAKCAMPSAETLSTFDTAFSGTVTSLDDGMATLQVDEWYAGDEAATVTVESPSKDLQDLLMAVDFQEGKTYLVSATDTRVTLCGFTAEQTPELQAMYAEAFAG